MGICNPQRTEPLKTAVPLGSSRGGTQGVDVSNNNGFVSFSYLRRNGIAFVYAKAEQECSTDSELANNILGARGTNTPLGIYDFIQPGRISPASDAACLAARAREVLAARVRLLPVTFDAESFNGLSGFSICSWLHSAEADLRADLKGVIEGVYGSPGTYPGCVSNGSHAWPADWLVSFPTNLGGFGSSFFNWQWFGPRFASGTLDGMDRDKGSTGIFSLVYRVKPPETPSQRRARERRELAAHEQLRTQLKLQQIHLRQKLLKFGCDRRVKHHLKTGPKCKGWKAAGNRVGAHIKRENAFISKLEREVRA